MKKLSIIEEAKKGKRLLNIFLVLILGMIIIFGGSAIGYALVNLMPTSLTSDNFWNMIFTHTFGFFPVAILVFFVVKIVEGRSSIGFRKKNFLLSLFWVFYLDFYHLQL